MHPALRNQPQRSILRHIVAEIQLEIMVSCHSLITALTKSAEIFLIELVDDLSYICSSVIPGAGNSVRRCHCCNGKPGGWNDKALIDVNIGTCRMINDHQAQLIV